MGSGDKIPQLTDVSDVDYILNTCRKCSIDDNARNDHIFYARDVKTRGRIKPVFSFNFVSNSGKLNRR